MGGINADKQRIAELENELQLRDDVVRDILGLELSKMIPTGDNKLFIEINLGILGCGVRHKIVDTISALSCDALFNGSEFAEYNNFLPFYKQGMSAAEQSKEAKKEAEITIDYLKSLLTAE